MSKSKETDINPFSGFNLLDERFDKSSEVNENTEETLLDFEKKDEVEPVIPKTEEIIIKDETKEEKEEELRLQQVDEPMQSDDFSYKPLVEHLMNKGILDYDEEEFKDEDFTNDEILEKVQEKTLERRFEKKLESYPDELKKAIDWVDNGGDIKQFYDYFYNKVKYSEIEISSDDSELQKAILRDSLRSQGEDEDRIESKIEKYELSGILEDEAKDGLERLKKLEAKQEQDTLKTQKEKAESDRLKQIEDWNNLKKAVLEAEDIAGFKVTPKIKEQIWEHMTKPVDKSGKTKLQINNETKGLKAKLLYAYLDLLDFDVNKLEKQVKTKVTSDLRRNLGKFTDNAGKSSATSKSQIDEPETDFSAFRKLI